MSLNLYVGNLPYKTNSDDLKDAFSEYGEVIRAAVIMDRETGRSRGYGFVEMETGGKEAIEAMDGFDMDGRSLKVNEARPRQPRAH
ncbi:RNA recognition motif (RRM, RBD, or RNP domain) [Polystyrenella longa]|uniref:RNA recognition motif (RRM, RBD, or RNP domain) n=1 Tax=Polystyrenella longa TaxID=2528007 RepID=A0A518CJL0_9PLAN|nr:RNA-binding protein [Polystyrenella longa]QDU79412.1 RNA recognition motif (RRM, RBD, or RNP domain) [Polystyrenella longa]